MSDADEIREMRDRTGLGLHECKRILREKRRRNKLEDHRSLLESFEDNSTLRSALLTVVNILLEDDAT
jgi:translation elongation factor EF-Ts